MWGQERVLRFPSLGDPPFLTSKSCSSPAAFSFQAEVAAAEARLQIRVFKHAAPRALFGPQGLLQMCSDARPGRPRLFLFLPPSPPPPPLSVCVCVRACVARRQSTHLLRKAAAGRGGVGAPRDKPGDGRVPPSEFAIRRKRARALLAPRVHQGASRQAARGRDRAKARAGTRGVAAAGRESKRSPWQSPRSRVALGRPKSGA